MTTHTPAPDGATALSAAPRGDPAAVAAALRNARTLDEMFALAAAAADPDDGYDLLEALDRNRAGKRPLFPPELKGVTW